MARARKYNTQEEINEDVINGVLKYNGNIIITFDCLINGDIKADNIKARNIDAWDIKAENIDAGNIDAKNINAWNIKAENIDALGIDAWNIKARNIDARDIKAENIDAGNIDYYSICIADESFKCKSIKGARKNSIHKCLDNQIIIGD